MRPYLDAGSLSLFLVYIREAHPEGGWAIPAADGICYRQPKTLASRLAVAAKFAEHQSEWCAGVPMLVDDPTTNALDIAYEAPPERLVVLDEQLNVVFASGQGPFQYSVPKLAAFVKAQLGE